MDLWEIVLKHAAVEPFEEDEDISTVKMPEVGRLIKVCLTQHTLLSVRQAAALPSLTEVLLCTAGQCMS